MSDSYPAVIATFGDVQLLERFKPLRQEMQDRLTPYKLNERRDQTHNLEISAISRSEGTDPDIIRVLVCPLYLNPVVLVAPIIRNFFKSHFPEVPTLEIRIRGNPNPHPLSYKK
jgi:hypothetical protein